VSWFRKIGVKAAAQLERDLEDNALDKAILDKGSNIDTDKAYQTRWVWYHTILAVEIFFTNVFLAAILVALLVIIAKM
jgi:hypothetical protein